MEYRAIVNSKLKHRNFLVDETVEILGKSVIIKHKNHSLKRIHIKFESDVFSILLPNEYDVIINREKLKKKIIGWYKEFAMKTILPRLSQFASMLKVSPSEVKVRSYNSRWGACRQDGRVIFNWRIIQAPLEIVDYVIIHELCHLKHMNHSKQFWNSVASLCPNYKELRKWLKENVLQLKFD